MLVRAAVAKSQAAPASQNVLKAVAGRMAGSTTMQSTRGSSFLSVDVHHDCVDMAIDCHQGDGTHVLDPMPLHSKPAYTEESGNFMLNYLKDVVQEGDVCSVLVSWPPRASSSSASGPSILNSLDTMMKESCSNDTEKVVAMTRPFYMLDGGGRRMASMCLVKDVHHKEALTASPFVSSSMEPSIGTWLRTYHDSIGAVRNTIQL